MLGRPFRIAWREDEGVLAHAYRHERDAELRPRLHALWLLRRRGRLGAVAELLGVHYRTVQQWVSWYRQGGLAEVRRHRQGGRQGAPSRLSPAQRQALLDQAATGAFATALDAVGWVAQQFGVPYTAGGMHSLFRRLRLKRKVPRPLAGQASLAAQAAWKRGGSRTRWLPSA
jgi:transposase